MSWAVSLIGRPDAIALELDKYADTLGGQDRMEFDEAKPHLQALLRENFYKTKVDQPVLQLEASGWGTTQPGAVLPGARTGITVPINRGCAVTIKVLSAKLV